MSNPPTLTRDTILQILRANASALKTLGVREIALFGWRADRRE